MARSKEELLKLMSDAVLEMEDDEITDLAEEYIEAGYPAFDGIMEGLIDFARAMVEADADVIAVSDPSGTGEILGPKFFE